MSGKTSIGKETSVRLNVSAQPGREQYQRILGSIHIHSGHKYLTEHGFSDADYKVFLTDPKFQFMIIGYGETGLLMVMKTSVTPDRLPKQSIERRIDDLTNEFIRNEDQASILSIVNFNKAVCTEMGLTMYIANEKNKDVLSRVEVTK